MIMKFFRGDDHQEKFRFKDFTGTLATPILKQCTTEQSNILNSFTTYRNITNISADGTSKLKIRYKKEVI